jgi:transporter family-2 protein
LPSRRRVPAAVALAAGALVAVQARLNSALSVHLGNGVLAAAINFGVGLVVLAVVVGARANGRAALRSVPSLVRGQVLPVWALLGGLGGATFVAGQTVTVAVLGVALFTVATVAGQTGMGLVVDRYGLGPTGRAPVSSRRLIAAGLATIAVAVAVSGGSGPSGSGVGALMALAIVAGTLVAFQAGFNGRVAAETGAPTVAALVNFTVGTVALLLVFAARQLLGHYPVSSPPHSLWLYLGGPMGVVFIVAAAWSVRSLGVLLFSLLTISGQLIGSVVVDALAPSPGTAMSAQLVVGVVLTGVAVWLAVSAGSAGSDGSAGSEPPRGRMPR